MGDLKKIIANYKILCKERKMEFNEENAQLQFLGVFDDDYDFCERKTELDCGLRMQDLPVVVDIKATIKMMIYDANIASKNSYYYDLDADTDE